MPYTQLDLEETVEMGWVSREPGLRQSGAGEGHSPSQPGVQESGPGWGTDPGSLSAEARHRERHGQASAHAVGYEGAGLHQPWVTNKLEKQ